MGFLDDVNRATATATKLSGSVSRVPAKRAPEARVVKASELRIVTRDELAVGADPRDLRGYSRRVGRRLRQSADVLQAGGNDGSAYGLDPIVNLVRRLPGQNDGSGHFGQLYLFELLRETLPPLNGGILARRTLEGRIDFEADDPGLLRELRRFAREVPVDDLADPRLKTGLDTWLNGAAENADTYGAALAQAVVGSDGVERLTAPHPRTLVFKRVAKTGEDGVTRKVWALFQRVDGKDVPVGGDFVKLLTFRPDPNGAWGRPLAWGLPFVAEIQIRMLVSLNNMWFRGGDPSGLYSITYEGEHLPSTTVVDEDLALLEDSLAQVFANRARGKTSDVFWSSSNGKGKLDATTIGDNNITKSLAPYFGGHWSSLSGHIATAAGVPSFMFPSGTFGDSGGLNTDRFTVEGILAASAAAIRNESKEDLARMAVDAHLVASGSARSLGRYSVRWRVPDMRDPAAVETARYTREQANELAIGNALLMRETGIAATDADRDAYVRDAGVSTFTGANVV